MPFDELDGKSEISAFQSFVLVIVSSHSLVPMFDFSCLGKEVSIVDRKQGLQGETMRTARMPMRCPIWLLLRTPSRGHSLRRSSLFLSKSEIVMRFQGLPWSVIRLVFECSWRVRGFIVSAPHIARTCLAVRSRVGVGCRALAWLGVSVGRCFRAL